MAPRHSPPRTRSARARPHAAHGIRARRPDRPAASPPNARSRSTATCEIRVAGGAARVVRGTAPDVAGHSHTCVCTSTIRQSEHAVLVVHRSQVGCLPELLAGVVSRVTLSVASSSASSPRPPGRQSRRRDRPRSGHRGPHVTSPHSVARCNRPRRPRPRESTGFIPAANTGNPERGSFDVPDQPVNNGATRASDHRRCG